MEAGWCGESPVTRFRFQVLEYDCHDYGGSGHWFAILFVTQPEKMGKYGCLSFNRNIGNWREYFGLQPIICSYGGKLPSTEPSGSVPWRWNS